MDRIYHEIEKAIGLMAKTAAPYSIKKSIPPRHHYPTFDPPSPEPYGTMMKSKTGTAGMVLNESTIYCFGCDAIEPAIIESWQPLEET